MFFSPSFILSLHFCNSHYFSAFTLKKKSITIPIYLLTSFLRVVLFLLVRSGCIWLYITPNVKFVIWQICQIISYIFQKYARECVSMGYFRNNTGVMWELGDEKEDCSNIFPVSLGSIIKKWKTSLNSK